MSHLEKTTNFRVFFLLQVDTQHHSTVLHVNPAAARLTAIQSSVCCWNAEFILLCQGGGGYGGGFNGGFNGGGGYRSRNDIERATEVKRSREAGTGDDFFLCRAVGVPQKFWMFWSHSCLHSRLLNRIPFWVSWPLMCTVSQSHRGWSILSIPTTNCSKRLVCCTCCHMLSRKVAIHQLKQVPSIQGPPGPRWLVRSRSKFENAEICTHAICPFIEVLFHVWRSCKILQTHFFVESKGSCFKLLFAWMNPGSWALGWILLMLCNFIKPLSARQCCGSAQADK